MRKTYLLLSLGLLLVACESEPEKPNFIVIFCDDLGYGDLATYGHPIHKTPNLDQMAQEGIKFTNFYVSSGVCTPSRSSLMTGCYSQRVDMEVNARPYGTTGRQVLFPVAKKGLNPDEITIAEILKKQGYSTACIGKWHLGDQPQFLPTRQGFDYYYGIPYSNDMNREYCTQPLLRMEKVIEAPVDQSTITKRYTEEAIKFIKEQQEKPFFLYLPHTMPHNPVNASEKFKGKSGNGLYGDAVEEIDWSTGQILATLKELELDQNTLVIFTSDNGAASNWGGSNAPLSGWKASTMEGGMRVPAIMWWPGELQQGAECGAMTTTMDLLPTFAKLAGGNVPGDRMIDGKGINFLLQDPTGNSPHEVFFYYQKEQLQAVRSGEWKLHLALDSTFQNIHRPGMTKGRPLKLVNLKEDIKEEVDRSTEHPDIVAKLQQYAEKARTELGDLGQEGNAVRKAGIEEDPKCLEMEAEEI